MQGKLFRFYTCLTVEMCAGPAQKLRVESLQMWRFIHTLS